MSREYFAFFMKDRSAIRDLQSGRVDVGRVAPLVTEIYAPAYDQESFVI